MTPFLMQAKTHLGVGLRIIDLSFRYLKSEQKMKKSSNLLIPMHKQLVKHVVDNVVVQWLNKFFGEDIVVFIENRKHLNKMKYTNCSKIEWFD